MITVLQVLEATEGGTRRHMRDLVLSLDPTRSCCVLALACDRDHAIRDDLACYASRGIRVDEIPMRRGVAPWADLVSLCRLVRCIRALRPDVIHAHSAKAGGVARVAGMLCHLPVVYTPHAFPFLMRGSVWRQRGYRVAERLLRGKTAAVIAVSREEAREALALGYPSRAVHLVPNGVAEACLAPIMVRRGEALQVGFFGRLTEQKGVDVLLASAADVVAHLPKTRFVIHGSGGCAASLEKQAAALTLMEHVRFSGGYAQNDVVSRMRQMDVIVIPSRWEGCPYVALEAFQAGVPVVASAVGGLKDLIRDGVNGLLVAPEECEALSDALLQLLRDPSQRAEMAGAARRILKTYTIPAMSDAVMACYRSVTAG